MYLVIVLLSGLYGLMALSASPLLLPNARPGTWLGISGLSPEMAIWGSAMLGGLCGGCAFALKWLYHGVANGKWHQDRTVWRVVVPILAAVLAVFTTLMVGSGVIPIFSRTVFDSWKAGAAFGFFIGFFSDNLIASLQRFAKQTLGTLESHKRDQSEQKDE